MQCHKTIFKIYSNNVSKEKMEKLHSSNVCCVVLLFCCVSLSDSFPQAGGTGSNPSACVVKEESSKQDKPCFLPFTFNNRIFSACTDFTDPERKHW